MLKKKVQHPAPDVDPLHTLNPISLQSMGDFSPTSTSSVLVPFAAIRRGGNEANKLPIPLLIRETARYGQLVPLSALTRSALNDFIVTPPTSFKLDIDNKKVSIASLNSNRSVDLSLEDLQYAIRRWLSLQKSQLYDAEMYSLWKQLMNKIMNWDDLPKEYFSRVSTS